MRLFLLNPVIGEKSIRIMKKSFLKTFAIVGSSSLLSSFSTLCGLGGAGLCGVACLPLVAVPFSSVFGISTAYLATWSQTLLPFTAALSAVAFTLAYINLYRKPVATDTCCDTERPVRQGFSLNPSKLVFWAGLLLTVGFYVQAIQNPSSSPEASCLPEACPSLAQPLEKESTWYTQTQGAILAPFRYSQYLSLASFQDLWEQIKPNKPAPPVYYQVNQAILAQGDLKTSIHYPPDSSQEKAKTGTCCPSTPGCNPKDCKDPRSCISRTKAEKLVKSTLPSACSPSQASSCSPISQTCTPKSCKPSSCSSN